RLRITGQLQEDANIRVRQPKLAIDVGALRADGLLGRVEGGRPEGDGAVKVGYVDHKVTNPAAMHDYPVVRRSRCRWPLGVPSVAFRSAPTRTRTSGPPEPSATSFAPPPVGRGAPLASPDVSGRQHAPRPGRSTHRTRSALRDDAV